MNNKNIKYILIVSSVIILFFSFKQIYIFFQIDNCLDRGGTWNYKTNECNKYYDINKQNLSEFFWKSDFDTIRNEDVLIKGNKLDSIGQSANELIRILNQRDIEAKIEFANISSDTITIKIINDDYLTEKMGTTGANNYLAETVFSLTENNNYNFVKILMEDGSHASSGIYKRTDFPNILIVE
jgi:hypothetical protein